MTEDRYVGGDVWFKLRLVARMKEIGRLPDRPDTCLLIAVNRDDMRLTVENRLLALTRGDIFISLPGRDVTYMQSVATEADETILLLFEMEGDDVARDAAMRRIAGDCGTKTLSNPLTAELMPLFEKAYQYWRMPDSWERLRSQAVFQKIVYLLPQQREAPVDNGLNEALERVRHQLERDYCKNLSIEHLAQQAGISSRHLRREFKGRFGVSPTEYVTELRMAQAKRLLAAKQPVSDIARQVGYQDESHFRRTFKAKTGIPPAVYVRNRKLRVAACSFPNIGQLLPLRVIPFAAPIDHEWTDVYRRRYREEVLYPLHHNNEANRRTLLAAKPDRILAIDAYGTDDFQQGLREIAPSLVIPWRTRSWSEHLLMTAAFLDKALEAEQWLASYEEKAEEVCERLTGKLLLMIDRQRLYRWRGVGRPFEPARHRAEADPCFEAVTSEELGGCPCDRIVLLLSEDRHSLHTWSLLRGTSAWRRHPAVRVGRVELVPIGPWFEYTAHNHGVILDRLEKLPI
ncbi:helix-turn-helix domain-containing protein [Cohnella hongkongensis]|uniref:Helix-turn-helix domain-containing protein n=1 Tax=Cohnella hongkongensis TaxID=178337 RepID=A0ABV9FIB5_9BACL